MENLWPVQLSKRKLASKAFADATADAVAEANV